jgi:HAD domain in Swiss Army Knife RNA repair proteins
LRVIFLDIDGVLNSESYMLKLAAKHCQLEPHTPCDCFKLYRQIDPEAIARLNRLVAVTEAKIVISSTWRKLFDPPDLRRILEDHGLVGEIIGETPDGANDSELRAGLRDGELAQDRVFRGNEIDFWLKRHPAVDRFVILDDGSDMMMHKNRLVQTDCEDGLCDEHVDLAIRVLAWDGKSDPPSYEVP